jgi:hypothetical protein
MFMVIEPLLAPKHVGLVIEIVLVTAGGCVMVIKSVEITQPAASCM